MEMILSQTQDDLRERFTAAVTEHRRAMYRAARALLSSDADAEDAVSEAILRAWQAFGRLRDEKAIKGWLIKITVNCAHEHHRRGARLTYDRENGLCITTIEYPDATPEQIAQITGVSFWQPDDDLTLLEDQAVTINLQ
ncbi:MAG TPA: sigma-70 family RNA polymerase sigma factor [Candidatus Agathobaculum merdipullorum]|nr:sigma-70 family RNA polymerase sigma factor [Candidatus Agathobaculum merdipullorum]